MSAATANEASLTLGGLEATAVGDREACRIVVVLLHGFAMTPGDLSPFAHSLGLPAWFLFPRGPYASAIGGRAWWPMDAALRAEAIARGPRDFADERPPELDATSARLDRFLDEATAIAEGRPIVVGGFSQGGMLTCHALLRRPRPIAGLALLSASRVAYDAWIPRLEDGAARGLPVLVSHGEADADLAFAAGVALKECLARAGASVTWLPFDQGHEIPLVVWRALRKFVLRVAGVARCPPAE